MNKTAAAKRVVVLQKPSRNVTPEQSEQKLDFLRKLWKATQLSFINQQRKAMQLGKIEAKAAWHKSNIAAWNREIVQFGASYPVAM